MTVAITSTMSSSYYRQPKRCRIEAPCSTRKHGILSRTVSGRAREGVRPIRHNHVIQHSHHDRSFSLEDWPWSATGEFDNLIRPKKRQRPGERIAAGMPLAYGFSLSVNPEIPYTGDFRGDRHFHGR